MQGWIKLRLEELWHEDGIASCDMCVCIRIKSGGTDGVHDTGRRFLLVAGLSRADWEPGR